MNTLLVLLTLHAAPPAARLDRYGDPLPPGAVARLGSVRFRHAFGMTAELAVSPDGSKVATYSDGLRVWDRATGRLLRRFEPIDRHSWSVAFSPDSRYVAAGHGGSEVRIYDLTTGEARPLWGDRKSRGIPHQLAFSRDGKTLAVLGEVSRGDDPTQLYVHDFPSGKARAALPTEFGHIIEGLAFDPSGRLVVPSVGVHLLDLVRGREVGRLGGNVGIYSFALSPDGKAAAIQVRDSGSKKEDDANVRIVRLDTGDVIRSPVAGPYRSPMAFSADGTEVLFASRNGPVTALDAATGKPLRAAVAGDGAWRPWAGFSGDGRWVARSDGIVIRVHDTRTGKEAVTFDDHRDTGGRSIGGEGTSLDAAVSPDGRRGLTRTVAELRVWDADTGRMRLRMTGKGFFPGAGWSADGRRVAAGRPGTFAWYDADTGKVTREVPLPAGEAVSARLLPDGERVVFQESKHRSEKPALLLLRSEDGKEVARYRNTEGDDFQGLSDDGMRALWSKYVEGGVVLRVEPGWERRFADAEARLVGGLLAVSTLDGVTAWDLNRDRPRGPRAGLRNRPKVLAASPDGRVLLVSQQLSGEVFTPQNVVRLVETASGQVRATLPYRDGVTGAVFHGHTRLITAGSDATALVWDVDELAAPVPLDRAWEALGEADGPEAFGAVVALSRSPAGAKLLRERLSPAKGDAKAVAGLVAALDAEAADRRDEAERRLASLDVEGDLAAALKGASLEARTRLERLLDRAAADREAIRSARAVEALERLGTPDALRLLRELAAGYKGARRTREAKEALERLRR